jgi:RNA polymerase sigma-70 factor (ECF subfamily)
MPAISAATERQFLATVAPCIPDLRRYAVSLTRNRADADDLIQETLLRAALKLHLWRPGSNIVAWLIVMMRRLHLSKFVSGKRNQTEMVPIEGWDLPAPANQTEAIEVREVEERWPSLSRSHREVLHLVAINGASYEEAAERLHVPIGTIRSRLARARNALRGEDRPVH